MSSVEKVFSGIKDAIVGFSENLTKEIKEGDNFFSGLQNVGKDGIEKIGDIISVTLSGIKELLGMKEDSTVDDNSDDISENIG